MDLQCSEITGHTVRDEKSRTKMLKMRKSKAKIMSNIYRPPIPETWQTTCPNCSTIFTATKTRPFICLPCMNAILATIQLNQKIKQEKQTSTLKNTALEQLTAPKKKLVFGVDLPPVKTRKKRK